MLHLRVYTAPEDTDPAIEVLREFRTTQWAVWREVCPPPAKDLITAEIVREAANDVIEALVRLGVQERGAIHIDPVDAWISRRQHEAVEASPGASADAVVWAQVTNRAYEDSELTWTYGSFMVMATLIAAIGIVLDSQILLIGAMVLGPEFGAVAALGLALIRRRRMLLRQAIQTLIIGFIVSICVTAVVALVARLLGWVTIEDVIGPRPLTAFIYTPDKWSLIVSLIAGAAGVLALTSAKAGGLTGVFISVTTVPAAGNVALALAFGAWHEVAGSSAQLAINLTGMAVSGWLTLVLQQFVWQRVLPGSLAYRARRPSRRSGP